MTNTVTNTVANTVRNTVRKAVRNRKLQVLLGPVVAIVMFAGAVQMASLLMSGEYRSPSRVPVETVDQTPRIAGLADEAEEAAEEGPDEASTRKPSTGRSRSLAVVWRSGRSRSYTCCSRRSSLPWPLFAFIIEVIGYKTGDPRYDPARSRVHEAPLRLLLAHGDPRSVSSRSC